jgi:hypothetical protein
MLAAKAFQGWSLYNGQEASTRYLDFAGRLMINPLGNLLKTNYLYIPKEKLNEEAIKKIADEFQEYFGRGLTTDLAAKGRVIQEKWMAFYEKHMPIVYESLKKEYPKTPEQDEVQYEKAIKARAFDIMRAFIPSGMTTLVSRHSNIRQLRDHLDILKYHPGSEVSRAAMTAIKGLQSAYPSSFITKEYSAKEEYLKLKAEKISYMNNDDLRNGDAFNIRDYQFDPVHLEKNYRELLEKRPEKTELPNEIGEAGVIHVSFLIDFGSFRDAQRHRKGVCKMPLLTTSLGFHDWYLAKLPKESRVEAEALIAELIPEINSLPCTDVERQYYIPMGFQVAASFTWSFDQCVYVAELRSSETVHPTFRVYAQALGKWIEEKVPYAALYVDYNLDQWSYKRGKQDIVLTKS